MQTLFSDTNVLVVKFRAQVKASGRFFTSFPCVGKRILRAVGRNFTGTCNALHRITEWYIPDVKGASSGKNTVAMGRGRSKVERIATEAFEDECIPIISD
jgi:hypothetical protein